MYKRDIYLDIDGELNNYINSVEFDSNSRFWNFHLTVDYKPLDLTGKTVQFRAEKPDKTNISNECRIVDAKNGVVEVELSRQVNAVPGRVKCILKIIGNNGFVLKTKIFMINVSKTLSDDPIVSSNEFGALDDALSKVQDIDNRFAQTNAQLSTINKRNDGFVNVKEFGAVGDGVTDDTDAIKEAVEFVKNNNSFNEIRFSSGTYLISDTINVPRGISFVGVGRPWSNNVSGTLLRRTKDVVILNCDGTGSTDENPYIGIQLRNITLTDVMSDYTVPLLKMKYCHYFLIQDCLFRGSNQIELEVCFDSRIVNTDFGRGGIFESETYGVTLKDGTTGSLNNNQIIFENCRFEGYRNTALYVGKYNNEIWLKTCKFESQNLNLGNHLKFYKAGTIILDVQICGKQQTTMIDFENTNHVTVILNFEHFFISNSEPFNKPVVKLNTCDGHSYKIIGDLNGLYSLGYLVENIGSSTNISITTDTSKKITNDETSLERNEFTNVIGSYNSRTEKTGVKSSSSLDSTDFWVTGQVMSEGDSLQWRLVHKKGNETIIPFVVSNDGTVRFSGNIVCNGTLTPKATSTRPWGSPGLTYVDTTNGINRVCTAINSHWINVSKNNSIPAVGTWSKGDIIYNSNPIAGGYLGWVCVTAGSPGVWKGFGLIEV